MRINIPVISGITPIPPAIREVVNSIEQIAQSLQVFSSNGIIARENLSHVSLSITNQEASQAWVSVSHSLKRRPLGYLLAGGSPASILDAILGDNKVEILLAAQASVTIALI